MRRKKQEVEKARFWKSAIREAAQSGVSVREFCRRRKLHESQFYWAAQIIGDAAGSEKAQTRVAGPESFALVNDEPGANDAGIELVLAGGRRLRIARVVVEATSRAGLAAVEPAGC